MTVVIPTEDELLQGFRLIDSRLAGSADVWPLLALDGAASQADVLPGERCRHPSSFEPVWDSRESTYGVDGQLGDRGSERRRQ